MAAKNENKAVYASIYGTNIMPLTYISDDNSFIEFSEHPCKFKDCMHLNEKVCSVKNAVEKGEILESRYNNYKKML